MTIDNWIAGVTVNKSWVMEACHIGLHRAEQSKREAINKIHRFRPFKEVKRENIERYWANDLYYFNELIKACEDPNVKQIHLSMRGYKLLTGLYNECS